MIPTLPQHLLPRQSVSQSYCARVRCTDSSLGLSSDLLQRSSHGALLIQAVGVGAGSPPKFQRGRGLNPTFTLEPLNVPRLVRHNLRGSCLSYLKETRVIRQ